MPANAKEKAKEARGYVRRIMGTASGTEEEVLNAFMDEFDAEMEGWKMRLDELEDE